MKPGIVITVYNEARSGWRNRENPDGTKSWQYEDELSEKYKGNELLATLDSIRASGSQAPVVIVDDGSDDGCTDRAGEFGADVVRNKRRIGIGFSRTRGVSKLPEDCDTVMFLDAHQRVAPKCIEFCSDLALKHDAIVWPDTRGIRDRLRNKKGHEGEIATQHGARPRTKPHKDEVACLFRNTLNYNKPPSNLSRTHALNSPGYTVPISVWNDMPISTLARGFGANEPMLWVKAFFLDVPILHTCDTMVRHLFRPGDAHYVATPKEVWRNMAILAKTAFDANTWDAYWWPKVFGPNVSKATASVLESDEMTEEHCLFQSKKKRPDSEFWLGLCREDVPDRRIA